MCVPWLFCPIRGLVNWGKSFYLTYQASINVSFMFSSGGHLLDTGINQHSWSYQALREKTKNHYKFWISCHTVYSDGWLYPMNQNISLVRRISPITFSVSPELVRDFLQRICATNSSIMCGIDFYEISPAQFSLLHFDSFKDVLFCGVIDFNWDALIFVPGPALWATKSRNIYRIDIMFLLSLESILLSPGSSWTRLLVNLFKNPARLALATDGWVLFSTPASHFLHSCQVWKLPGKIQINVPTEPENHSTFVGTGIKVSVLS